jgi:hypothetical protein
MNLLLFHFTRLILNGGRDVDVTRLHGHKSASTLMVAIPAGGVCKIAFR